jgi:putative inorganic carbon (hco3(-)) transporter
MRHNSHIVDYEPVTTLRGAKTEYEEYGDSWLGDSSSDAQPPLAEADRKEQRSQDIEDKKAIKRGHAVSFAGLVVFTAIVYFRPYELFPSLAWTSSSAFWVGILTLLVYVPTQLGLEGNLTIRPAEIKLVLLLLLAALVSTPLAIDRRIAWTTFTDFLKVVLMFIVMVNVVRTEKRLKGLLLLALITSCILGAAAANDYRLGRLSLGLHERIRGLIGNLFENPNDLALHLVTMAPLAVALLLVSRGSLKKVFFAGATVLIVAGVVATFSRGGFIGMCFAMGLLVWRLAKRNKGLIAICLPPALAVFVLLAPGGYGTRIGTSGDDSFVARFNDFKRSLFVAVHHPVIGVGMNNYIRYSNLDHATHNAYTQVGSELGLPAMAVYIMFLLIPLKRLRRIERETSATRQSSQFFYLAVGLEASLVGYMASSFFLSVAYLWYLYYLVGYTVCFWRLYEASQNDQGRAALGRANPGKRQPDTASYVLAPESTPSL